ncbi:MAG: hypothetical protein HN909_04920, partial [Phycisphaerales bacterium]|nr:hypothetical protein [Phycisphaerales bacterium]
MGKLISPLIVLCIVAIALATPPASPKTAPPHTPAPATAPKPLATQPVLLLPRNAVKIVTEKRKDAQGREYWLHRPATLEQCRPYFLVVAAHAYGDSGKEADAFKILAHYGNCIVVCPTFVPAYISLGKGTDKQLLDLFAALKKEFVLHDKLFLTGASGGSQYAHRFTLRHPAAVLGCAAHAGGAWCTDRHTWRGDEALSDKIRTIPFVVSCGTADRRLQNTVRFAGELVKGKYCVKEIYWAGLGHALDVRTLIVTVEGYFLSAYGLDPIDGARFDKRVSAAAQTIRTATTQKARTAAERRSTTTYLAAVSAIYALSKTKRFLQDKETLPLNAPKRATAPNEAGWHLPPSKTNWLDEHFDRCKARWTARLSQVLSARALAEVNALTDITSADSQRKIKSIIHAFAKLPKAQKALEDAI